MQNGWKTREEMEATERATLAPFAQKSGDSRGRKHPEQKPCLPDRISTKTAPDHSLARISPGSNTKPKVFLNGTGDHLRTRLTHSIEVASISRTIARALALNEDLAEAIALAHDLGHTPFGHSGERNSGRMHARPRRFEHNRQSLPRGRIARKRLS